MKLYVYPSDLEGEEYHYVSMLEPAYISEHGLTVRSIIGKLKDASKGITSDNIIYNPVFITLLHKSVREGLVDDEALLDEAARKVNGFIYIIDARAQAGEDVLTEDIIGAFPVKDKKIISEGYIPSPKYLLISQNDQGFILPPKAQSLLLEEITK